MFVLGEQVRLRAIEPADAEALWRWNHDPEGVRWLGGCYAQSLSQGRTRLAERPRNGYSDVLFGVALLADSTLIGVVRLHDAEPETACAEMDVYLGEPEYRGAGTAPTRYARCAASASRR